MLLVVWGRGSSATCGVGGVVVLLVWGRGISATCGVGEGSSATCVGEGY